jgi:phospholipid/cholesterol/gamma-HCH transport system permease protein
MNAFFELFGKPLIYIFKTLPAVGQFFIFYIKLLPLMFIPPYRFKEIFKHIENIGVQSWGVIALTAIFTGMIEAIQLYSGFKQFGAENFMGYTIFVSITKELGPVFATLMVISRAISAMSAELGTMRVTEQIDAIDILGIDSRRYLIIPRIIATTISLPLLVIFFDFLSNGSAFLISTSVLDLNPTTYQNIIQQLLSFSDIYTGVFKSIAFGFVIALIGAYIGYFTEGGAKGVGEATTKAVVLSSVSVFAVNYLFSSLFFLLGY